MISRAATVVLAAVIALGAANAAPLSRSRYNPELYSVASQLENTRQQQIVSAQPAPDYPPRQPGAGSPREQRVATRQFVAYLYQRPPPALSF